MAICLLWPYAYYGYMLTMASYFGHDLTAYSFATLRWLLYFYGCTYKLAGRHLHGKATQHYTPPLLYMAGTFAAKLPSV